jgi:hypothetical protein
MTRVLICGGRDYQDWGVYDHLDRIHSARPFSSVITGGARGADLLAGYWAERRGIPSDIYPADWAGHGRAAGPIRNQKMLDEGKPDLVVAFPGGRGTADMVRRARKAGVAVIEA